MNIGPLTARVAGPYAYMAHTDQSDWDGPQSDGSNVAGTATDGRTVWRQNYTLFGERLQTHGISFDQPGYTGHVDDSQTGLTYMQARYYDPVIGRFLANDPVGFVEGGPTYFNRYAYAGNDPINATDPTGQYIESAIDIASLAAGGASFVGNIRSGNIGGAVVDAVGIAVDGAALAVPGVPGGAGLGIKAARGAGAAADAAKGANAAKRSPCSCFLAGTLVSTSEGDKPIEEIALGDLVYGWDEATGTIALKAVTDLIKPGEKQIWHVTLEGVNSTDLIKTTDDHPWWVAGKGWVETKDLRAGMAVVTQNGRGMTIASAQATDQRAEVHNLTIEDFHTFFVGKDKVLVHNCEISRQKQDAHNPGTKENTRRKEAGSATSTFTDAQTGEALTKDTVKTGTPVPGRPGVKDKEFGGHVGTGPNGGTQTKVRTHTDANGVSHGHPAGREFKDNN